MTVRASSQSSGDTDALDGATWSILRSERTGEGTVLLSLAGEIDMAAYGPVSAVLLGLEHNGCDLVVIDLQGATLVDCMGLRVVAEALARSRAGGWALIVVAPPAPADRVFELAELPAGLHLARSLPKLGL